MKDEFFRAKVISVLQSGEIIEANGKRSYQDLKIKFLDGPRKNEEISLRNTDLKLKINETVVVSKSLDYQIIDHFRLNQIYPIIISFFIFVIILSKWKGVGSILGMLISLGVIAGFIVPQILQGSNPLFITIIGSLVIMITTIYLAHGFSKRTSIAILCTFVSLILVSYLSGFFVNLLSLTGLGSEDSASLLYTSGTEHIDFKGLLLGGILIGSLGVLDDITTGLTASIHELKKSNPKLNFSKLFKSGMEIGREHIASLVNTLVLAYAGTSLPIFITIILNPVDYPMWMIFNDQFIVEEIVRTLSGSFGLVFAVPLTALIASASVSRPVAN